MLVVACEAVDWWGQWKPYWTAHYFSYYCILIRVPLRITFYSQTYSRYECCLISYFSEKVWVSTTRNFLSACSKLFYNKHLIFSLHVLVTLGNTPSPQPEGNVTLSAYHRCTSPPTPRHPPETPMFTAPSLIIVFIVIPFFVGLLQNSSLKPCGRYSYPHALNPPQQPQACSEKQNVPSETCYHLKLQLFSHCANQIW